MNMSDNEVDATFSWRYLDPDTSDYVTAEEYDLSEEYHPDYTSDFTTRNNLFYLPELTASAPGHSNGTYKAPYNYFQAGGAADFEFPDGMVHMGLLPFSIQTDGIAGVTLDYEAAGDMAMPLFGHNENTRAWWTDHYFMGEAAEGEYAEVKGLINFIYPVESPMVMKGGWVNVRGEISDDAELSFGIYPVDDEFVPSDTPHASAVCKGSDIRRMEDFNSLPFVFDAPMVIDNSYQAYILKLTGFDSDACPYFLPMQSLKPNIDGLCLGFLDLEINSNEFGLGHSFVPLANFEGDYGDMLNAFCMNIDGYYPWLKAGVDKVEITSDGSVDIPLDSYYDAADLSFKCPMGTYISSANGRYGNTVVTITHDMSEVIAEGDLVITAPGVEAVVAVSEVVSSVSAVDLDSAEVRAVYTISGTESGKDGLTPGIYVVRYADGKVRKITEK